MAFNVEIYINVANVYGANTKLMFMVHQVQVETNRLSGGRMFLVFGTHHPARP